MKQVRILGTRGIPAAHGGFETFTESLAPYLAAQGWDVTVYCQRAADDTATQAEPASWRGVKLKYIVTGMQGALGTIVFDWRCTLDALRSKHGVNLVLGYNTALFSLLYRLGGRRNLINMDGLEWRRSKWSRPIRAWFYLNERLACWLGHHLIADNPEIARHLATRVSSAKITMIPYGADVQPADSPTDALADLALSPGDYALLVARPEPENSILQIVRAFASRPRKCKLVVLGHYDPAHSDYQRRVLEAAGEEVRFVGAIFDRRIIGQLRAHARLYIHGHQVGGTNPALVEAMAAGCAVLAHDNPFNRWVAGPGAAYFADQDACAAQLAQLLDAPEALSAMRTSSRARFASDFTWDAVLPAYARLLEHWSLDAEARTNTASQPGSIRSS